MGITPAYAGSTPHTAQTDWCFPDHPRVRGEHVFGAVGTLRIPGSPPRTRGARTAARLSTPPTRITPAYAGSTSAQPTPSRRGPDHPRVRGEHSSRLSVSRVYPGSPPRTRGAHAKHRLE